MKNLYLATGEDDNCIKIDYRLVLAESKEDALLKLKKIYNRHYQFEITEVIEWNK